MSDRWIREVSRFDLLLGEFLLFSPKLDVVRWDGHFTELDGNAPVDLHRLHVPESGMSALIPSYPIRERLPRFKVSRPFLRYVPTQYRHYYVELEGGDFDQYLNKFSSKSRYTLRKKVRKFEEFSGGTIEWREFASADDILVFHKLARQISAKTYQERLLNAGLPEDDRFCRELVERARQGKVKGYLLFSRGRPIAYICCPLADGVLFYQYVGYDPEFREWSPGTLLQYVVLDRLFREGRFRMFDFTAGEGAHKQFFATGSILCADIYLVRATIRNVAVVLSHSGFSAISHGFARATDKLGAKSALKRWFRNLRVSPRYYLGK